MGAGKLKTPPILMKPVTISITPEIKAALGRTRIEGNILFLPYQLDPKVYKTLNQLLQAHGGNWNRKLKGFLFEGDPYKAIETLIDQDEMLDEKRTLEAFYSPQAVAQCTAGILGKALGGLRGKTVLEPSAGGGALAQCAADLGAEIQCVEINPKEAQKLAEKWKTLTADFLTLSPSQLGLFDGVIMNPPFNKNADAIHIAHACTFLKPGGVLVAIAPAIWAPTRSHHHTIRENFQNFLDICQADYHPLPEGSFSESGTGVNTVILTIKKP